jgi:hypothetical protein
LLSSSFLRHCDETKTLRYPKARNCLKGADGQQFPTLSPRICCVWGPRF